MQKIYTMLTRPVDSRLLGLFRIFFGVCIIYELWYYVQIDLLNRGLRQPVMLFPYKGLEWIHMLPGKGMEIILFLTFAAAFCITAGFMLRIASIVFFAGFSWIFFQDKGLYNNHLYLFILISILFFITDADAALSVSRKKHRATLPAWQLMIFQFQIIVVYFYGGLAKLNGDWLIHLQPARVITHDNSGSLFIYIIVYGGLLFDLFIGFALLWRRSRTFAFIIAFIFNITNAVIFNDIGVFPFFMIGTLMLFMDPELPAKWFKRSTSTVKKKGAQKQEVKSHADTSNFKWGFLALYVAFQLLFPFRHVLYKGNVDWYGEAQRFSWRMKIQQRELNEFQLTVLDYNTKNILNLDPSRYLTSAQLLSLKQDPQMLLAFVKYIESDAKKKGIRDPYIKARCIVSFNGRPPQTMVDPEKNLCTVNSTDPVWKWVTPLKNP
jgi:vitamin K-dependent gamma-carboxylase